MRDAPKHKENNTIWILSSLNPSYIIAVMFGIGSTDNLK